MSGKPFVPVVDRHGHPLMPCTGKRARLLLQRKRARVYHRFPFVIQLLDRDVSTCELQDIEVKLDPGSKTTGMAVVRKDARCNLHIIQLFELEHRGQEISRKLKQRVLYRRARRQRNTRYRPARFLNRTKPQGWLPPSLQHRVDTTLSWIAKFRRWYPVSGIVVERVKFDTQRLNHPEITGVEYQRGTLFGYELREYMLEKWCRKCAYCDTTQVMRFELDHIVSKSQGGSDRVSNLTLSCRPCNQRKGALSIQAFLQHDPARLQRILRQAKMPLKDAAAMNATRNRLLKVLVSTGLPVETSTGGQTKYNRCRLSIPKTHALDAVCAGQFNQVYHWQRRTTVIRARGRGRYQRTLPDKYGFPRQYNMRRKRHFGFMTGDIAKFVKSHGVYVGRLTVKASGGFTVSTVSKAIPGYQLPLSVVYRACQLIQRYDGYYYHQKELLKRSSSVNTLSII